MSNNLLKGSFARLNADNVRVIDSNSLLLSKIKAEPEKKQAEEKKPEPVAEEAPKRKPGRPKKAAAPAETAEEAPKKATRKRKKAE